MRKKVLNCKRFFAEKLGFKGTVVNQERRSKI